MFFIGIAGSFLPYLLLTGILLVLTLGMNKSQDLVQANVEEKKIEINDSNNQQSFTADNSFYFYNKIDTQKVKKVSQGINPISRILQESPPKIFSVFLLSKEELPTLKSYSGLSPPVMVS